MYNTSTRDIERALDRLYASSTPRTRANALKAFSVAIKALHKDVAGRFPKLRADGTAIVKRKPRGARCPLCSVPVKSHLVLVHHLMTKHNTNHGECVCGKVFHQRIGSKVKSPSTQLARHLAGLKDIRSHFAEAVMQQAAGSL